MANLTEMILDAQCTSGAIVTTEAATERLAAMDSERRMMYESF